MRAEGFAICSSIAGSQNVVSVICTSTRRLHGGFFSRNGKAHDCKWVCRVSFAAVRWGLE